MPMSDDLSVITTLTLGLTDFRLIRGSKKVFIEKTDLIAEVGCISAPVLLSRPNGFGKTTLVSTFNELFGNGLRNFNGLKISQQGLWKDKTYFVMNLSVIKCVILRLKLLLKNLSKLSSNFIINPF